MSQEIRGRLRRTVLLDIRRRRDEAPAVLVRLLTEQAAAGRGASVEREVASTIEIRRRNPPRILFEETLVPRQDLPPDAVVDVRPLVVAVERLGPRPPIPAVPLSGGLEEGVGRGFRGRTRDEAG